MSVTEKSYDMLNSVSLHCRFALFVDDLSLSGPAGLQRMIPSITRIFKEAGFVTHPNKTTAKKGDEDKEVLGIRVNQRLEPSQEFRLTLAAARQSLPRTNKRLKGLESWQRTILKANTQGSAPVTVKR
jgi:hypothetical protein